MIFLQGFNKHNNNNAGAEREETMEERGCREMECCIQREAEVCREEREERFWVPAMALM